MENIVTEFQSRADFPYVSDHFPVEINVRYRLQFKAQNDQNKPVKSLVGPKGRLLVSCPGLTHSVAGL